MNIASKNLKSFFITIALCLTPNIHAIIANPEPFVSIQPDGSQLEIILNGDEHFNYYSTTDGIPVSKNYNDEWVFSKFDLNGTLTPTEVIAKSKQMRTSEENKIANSFIPNKKDLRNIYYKSKERKGLGYSYNMFESSNPQSEKYSDTNPREFRGLVILVEYNDKSFSRPDICNIFNDMINKEGYTGFQDLSGKEISYTGSVRDYFLDNSRKLFSPHFDIVGPVKVPYSCKAPQQTAGIRPIIAAALDGIDDQVNFKDYDSDGDGKVDMIYLIFAGAGSNVSGNSYLYLWPHASILTDIEHDGVELGRYACSTELYGLESRGIIDGIGVICHEFSHVLGLPDLYDVDYATGGQSIHPGEWSIMAGGAYLNSCRTPASYCAYEQYASKFITPEVIEHSGDYVLEPLSSGGKALKINSSVPDEFFLLECKRKNKWDEHLPGEGLIVWRVDSTDASAWSTNRVNASPEHCYMELIRANSQCTTTTVKDTDSDPFPGASSIFSLTNSTTPSIRSWTGIDTPYTLTDINFSEGKAIVRITSENIENVTEDFENMPVSDQEDTAGLTGVFGTWNLTKAKIVSPENSDYCHGKKALSLVKNSQAEISGINKSVRAISMNIANSSVSTSIIRCYYRENGADWTILRTNDGSENISTGPKSKRTVTYPCNLPNGVELKLLMSTGNSSTPVYIDNLRLLIQNDSQSEVLEIADGNNLTVKKLNNLSMEITSNPELGPVFISDLYGRRIAVIDNQEQQIVELPSSGIYIIHQNNQSIKMIF